MSADELRLAADTLRALSDRADEDYMPGHEERWFRADGTHAIQTTWTKFAASFPNEAPYIASLNPDVGRALADWLDAEGRGLGSDQSAFFARHVASLINGPKS